MKLLEVLAGANLASLASAVPARDSSAMFQRVIPAAAVIVLMATGQACFAASPCTVERSAGPPAVVERVTCDVASISRYFLLSPTLASLTDSERAAVIAQPLRYAFAYMSADAIDRLRDGFAINATNSVDLTEVLLTRDKDGVETSHEAFRLNPTRTDVAGINWKTVTAGTLFQRLPTEISPYLRKEIAAEEAKATPHSH